MPQIQVPGIGTVDADGFAEEQTMQRILAAIQNDSRGGTAASGGVQGLDRASKQTMRSILGLGRSSSSAGQQVDSAGRAISDSGQKIAQANLSYARSVGLSTRNAAAALERGPLEMITTAGAKFKDIMLNISEGLGAGVGGAVAAFTEIGAVIGGATIGDLNKMGEEFRKAQNAGALFGGSMVQFRALTVASGLSMSQFNTVLQKSGNELAMFGGTTSTGAQEFAQANNRLIQNHGESMLRMGVSFEEMGSRTAEFMAMVTESGVNFFEAGYDVNALATSVQQLTVRQKALAAINGTTLEQEREKMRQQRKDAQMNAIMMGLSAEQRTSVQELSAQFPQATQFIKEFVAFGGPVSKEGAMQQAMMGATTDAIGQTLTAIQQGADPKAAMDSLRAMSENSGAIAAETEAMADLVKLGVAGSTNSFVQMAEKNFNQQFELSNKLRAGVVEQTLAEFETGVSGGLKSIKEAVDPTTEALVAMNKNQQLFSNALSESYTNLYGSNGFGYSLGTANDVLEGLIGTIRGATRILGGAGTEGTGTLTNVIPGSTQPAVTPRTMGTADATGLDKYLRDFTNAFATQYETTVTDDIEQNKKLIAQNQAMLDKMDQESADAKALQAKIDVLIQQNEKIIANTKNTANAASNTNATLANAIP